MRPKVIAIVLFAALCLAGVLVMVSRRSQPEPTAPIPQAVLAQTNSPVAPPATIATAAAHVSTNATNHAEYIRQRRDELLNLAMHNDSASLETILAELQNPDRQIRRAALEATVQFSDRSAIPRLRDLASRTTDEDEKAEIEAAADYLALPSLTEVMAQQQAQRAAMGITNAPPQSRTNPIVRRRPLVQPAPAAPAGSIGNP